MSRLKSTFAGAANNCSENQAHGQKNNVAVKNSRVGLMILRRNTANLSKRTAEGKRESPLGALKALERYNSVEALQGEESGNDLTHGNALTLQRFDGFARRAASTFTSELPGPGEQLPIKLRMFRFGEVSFLHHFFPDDAEAFLDGNPVVDAATERAPELAAKLLLARLPLHDR